MMIVISLLAGAAPGTGRLLCQILGGAAIIAVAAFAVGRRVRLPLAARVRKDHELQVFAALLICFGLAFITGALGLSSALGAFVAGMIVASARETDWVQGTLDPLRVIFLGLLFVSMGMQIDLEFISRT